MLWLIHPCICHLIQIPWKCFNRKILLGIISWIVTSHKRWGCHENEIRPPPPTTTNIIIPSKINHCNGYCKFCVNRGLDMYKKGLNQKYDAPSFSTRPLRIGGQIWNFFENHWKSSKISISLFGKRCSRTSSGCHASTEKDRALWFFLLDCNGQTWIYRLVWGPMEVQFQRNLDFATEDDDCHPRLSG